LHRKGKKEHGLPKRKEPIVGRPEKKLMTKKEALFCHGSSLDFQEEGKSKKFSRLPTRKRRGPEGRKQVYLTRRGEKKKIFPRMGQRGIKVWTRPRVLVKEIAYRPHSAERIAQGKKKGRTENSPPLGQKRRLISWEGERKRQILWTSEIKGWREEKSKILTPSKSGKNGRWDKKGEKRKRPALVCGLAKKSISFRRKRGKTARWT